MKPYTEPQGLQSWLQRLKEYLEELPSKLVHSEPRYEKLGPRCEDTEHRIENASPSIDVVTPYFPAFAPRMRLSRSAFRKLLAFGMVTLFMIPWLMFLWRGGSWFANKRSGSDDPVLNATLGFQEVFALALPDRMDRVQTLLDAASATHINITILDAIRDVEIPEEDWPKGWSESSGKRVGELGCLTSHVRAWKKMIDENIESALIMESDADWDLRIKESLQGVATAAKRLVDWPFDGPTRPGQFPYGDSWDIIWIGHCGAWNHHNHRIFSFNDSSVPPEEYEYTFVDQPRDEQHLPGTRSVFPLGSAVCAVAYAISNAGAVKFVREFSEGSDNLDLRISGICSQNQNVTCLGVWPQLASAAITESNIDHPAGEAVTGGEEVIGWRPGPSLQYSARLNAEKAIRGSPMEEWEPQWNTTWALKDDTWTMVDFDEAKELLAETGHDAERKNGDEVKRNFWERPNVKNPGPGSSG